MCSFFFQRLKSCYATCVFSVTLSPFPLLTLSLSLHHKPYKSTTSNKPLMSHVYGLETYTYSILIEQKPKMTFGMFTICLDDCIRFILSMVGMIMSPPLNKNNTLKSSIKSLILYIFCQPERRWKNKEIDPYSIIHVGQNSW